MKHIHIGELPIKKWDGFDDLIADYIEDMVKESDSLNPENLPESDYYSTHVDFFDHVKEICPINHTYEEQGSLLEYLYCCSVKEQDKWLDTLRQAFATSTIENIYDEVDIVKNSDAFKALRLIIDIKYDMEDFWGHANYLTPINNMGIDPKWVVRIGRVAECRLKKEIGQIIKESRKRSEDDCFKGS